ncbi:MAG TPA: methionine--tRNA ligase [Bacteroidetes bacterium]|nr:methionine--tRNA ligase [Bacteroidota bacterium]
MKDRIIVTSALPYANGPLHIGHIAGAYLPADIYVRYNRLKKRDILFICGSDENGVPIMLRARKEGVSPQAIVDRYHAMNKQDFEKFGISFDYYGRTSSATHRETSQGIFRRLAENGVFRLKTEKQLYDPEAKLFLADRFVYGTCPKCGYENAYGDQCEKCGTSLSPADLIDPKSAVTNTTPVMKETTHWYLPLAEIQPRLEKWIASHPDWKPNVLGQVKSWFADGLKDRAVTRDLPWGVPVPEDVAAKEGVDVENKVLYVWFDAPIGYISATKEWAQQQGDPELWKKYWQDENASLVHFIGKDNIVFHCLIFPAMLMMHGDFVLPDNVPANEFLNLEGNKLSTSRNYAVWLKDYLEKFEPDSLRYTLAANLPETRDADFSWKEFQARHNNELADIIGNFINRTFTFLKKNFDGVMPPAAAADALDEELEQKIQQARETMGEHIEHFRIKEATRELMDLARFANKYFNDKAPWKTRKEDPEQCASTLNRCANTAYALAVMMQPIMPFSAEKIWKILNAPGSPETAKWDAVGTETLPVGHRFDEVKIVFKKIEDEVIQKEIDTLQAVLDSREDKGTPPEENVEQITIDEFARTELRVGRILSAEKMKGADRLLKLQVDLGTEKRQIIAGIAQHYSPEQLTDRKVVVVANLKPAKLRGELSEGMVLAAVAEDGSLSLVAPDEATPVGARVR